MQEWFRKSLITLLSVLLCLFTIVFVNYNLLQPQSALALFVMLGMVLCFLQLPAFKWLEPLPGSQPDSSASSLARLGSIASLRIIDLMMRYVLAGLTVVCFGYIFLQTEPVFESLWPDAEPFTRPTSLGDRAGEETTTDYIIGLIGIVLVLEATRRSIGWIVPCLAILFILHAYFAPHLPNALYPHQGLTPKQITSSTFLQSLGVLGPAAGVMFRFVFLFVVFGAFLEMSGATQFIIGFSERLFGRTTGGPAKVAVLGSGLMGSLSGSAVANAVTTGSFTIPMMRSAGFTSQAAGGITAAAATGGALVPPVMGAGAYMMLEFVERPIGQPQVTFLEIAKAALIPAFLYYFSLFLIVHFYSANVRAKATKTVDAKELSRSISVFEGVVFFSALAVLVTLLIFGFSPFKAVTGSLILILVLSVFRRQLEMSLSPRVLALIVFLCVAGLHQATMLIGDAPFFQDSYTEPLVATPWLGPDGAVSFWLAFESLLDSAIMGALCLLAFGLIHPAWRPQVLTAFRKAANNGIALVAASACVGIIIGIVQTTPIANDFSADIKSIVESDLLLALIGIMICSIILGMGVPSVVCYLLMATLMGSLLGELGVDPLAAHLFIFYFGMMSMVTPPVALAAYASASIAEARIMRTAVAAFKFSLVGFTLPFMFIYRPALLMMPPVGETLNWWNVIAAIVASGLGVVALAGSVTGYMRNRLPPYSRVLLVMAAILLLAPNVGGREIGLAINFAGGILLAVLAVLNKPGASEAEKST